MRHWMHLSNNYKNELKFTLKIVFTKNDLLIIGLHKKNIYFNHPWLYLIINSLEQEIKLCNFYKEFYN
jgi:uncharacterized protein YvpB